MKHLNFDKLESMSDFVFLIYLLRFIDNERQYLELLDYLSDFKFIF